MAEINGWEASAYTGLASGGRCLNDTVGLGPTSPELPTLIFHPLWGDWSWSPIRYLPRIG